MPMQLDAPARRPRPGSAPTARAAAGRGRRRRSLSLCACVAQRLHQRSPALATQMHQPDVEGKVAGPRAVVGPARAEAPSCRRRRPRRTASRIAATTASTRAVEMPAAFGRRAGSVMGVLAESPAGGHCRPTRPRPRTAPSGRRRRCAPAPSVRRYLARKPASFISSRCVLLRVLDPLRVFGADHEASG